MVGDKKTPMRPVVGSATSMLLAWLLVLATNVQAQGDVPAPESRWALGVGLAAGAYPHYPGASQSETAVAPFPYPEYRSERLRLDRDGLAARLFKTDRLELDISLNGAIPVSSDDNDLRAGMNDLELMIEVGPVLEMTLADWGDSQLRFDLPFRAAFEVTAEGLPEQAGWSFDPRIHYERQMQGWEWEVDVGGLWGSQDYHDVFYSVAAEDVTALRPEYAAKSGLLGWRVSTTIEKQVNDWRWLGYLRLMALSQSANSRSPLLARNSYMAGGVAVIWMFRSN